MKHPILLSEIVKAEPQLSQCIMQRNRFTLLSSKKGEKKKAALKPHQITQVLSARSHRSIPSLCPSTILSSLKWWPSGTLAGYQQFEPVFQGAHVRICILAKLERVWDDLDTPVAQLGVSARLEAEVEVAWEFRVQAKGVHGSLWIGFRVSFKPLI